MNIYIDVIARSKACLPQAGDEAISFGSLSSYQHFAFEGDCFADARNDMRKIVDGIKESRSKLWLKQS
ncbi:MAG: hypothetical protein A3C43_12565 [Candidatus Schekmanbacteria bacterium RIFCSPHIGHO2_02_FULL_38_11]|uniref:Uncharacterized protein n=1 Tax=Candidatus Schekmanbacteria bacterium RIFCSPLOWO2_12_FULL_38_15 TaxID=1817883 RepID=A0A1F7SHY3_9BACT|nr:MAG: hypothetical protein A2043_04060 [Candidatus Schekmanbacteria bacterium GWA2_38_9]OGL50823.1 MAG: hypothetical protein A3H37_03155 [Candidatus Schekmanbacteria bacterium RIFCSPLOWO2_02_FULL_38_14]OGL53416.1 MAG: hypothetical protein A3G31_07910 [Candidatus Schekmanbacteria bacterium RIFCSPLOWO2_12_FULL_38_15]OGL55768.1 MAG: hypothetical protein A3C43_12565 [Candidatus Schekmanbacteria bacterium RIFCSPHIGHO2_02_FULL_38_11]